MGNENSNLCCDPTQYCGSYMNNTFCPGNIQNSIKPSQREFMSNPKNYPNDKMRDLDQIRTSDKSPTGSKSINEFMNGNINISNEFRHSNRSDKSEKLLELSKNSKKSNQNNCQPNSSGNIKANFLTDIQDQSQDKSQNSGNQSPLSVNMSEKFQTFNNDPNFNREMPNFNKKKPVSRKNTKQTFNDHNASVNIY
jgi:hypothetical protein